jgi:hypothetical protein
MDTYRQKILLEVLFYEWCTDNPYMVIVIFG